MTHPDAPPVEPICPNCGHPASFHSAIGIYKADATRTMIGRVCDKTNAYLYRTALTAARDEIARLKGERKDYRLPDELARLRQEVFDLTTERDALARDAERWRYVERNLFVSAPDAETGEVEVTFQSGLLDEIANKMWRDGTIEPTSLRNGVYTVATPVIDAARSAAPTTEN